MLIDGRDTEGTYSAEGCDGRGSGGDVPAEKGAPSPGDGGGGGRRPVSGDEEGRVATTGTVISKENMLPLPTPPDTTRMVPPMAWIRPAAQREYRHQSKIGMQC